MNFKRLTFHKRPNVESISAQGAVGFDGVYAYKYLENWFITFVLNDHWGDNWGSGCLQLPVEHYSEDEVMQIMQDAWEYYITKNCFLS